MTLQKIVSNNITLIKDNILVLEKLSLKDYLLTSNAFSNKDNIGKHIRHIFNFYEAVLASYSSGIINYEIRTRDSFIETRVKRGKEYAQEILKHFYKLQKNSREKNILFKDNNNTSIQTSFSRELISAQEHTIHHNAMIRLILYQDTNKTNIILPNNFGIAPSTLRYREKKSL